MQAIQTMPASPAHASCACPDALLPGVCRGLNLRRRQHVQLRCAEGVVWITQEGCLKDVLLNAGQCLNLEGPGRVVLSALEPAIVEFGFPQAWQ